MAPPIADYNTYTSGMAKSIEDKLFWLDMIPKSEYDIVIDYGCADGQFLREVRKRNPECFICGIDIDDVMLEKAKIINGLWNAEYINEVNKNLPENEEVINGVLNLSSVIHEVYSYKSPEDIEKFWKYVFGGHKYICIRDMAVSENLDNLLHFLPLRTLEEYERRLEFAEIWGNTNETKNFVHYMLKYRYVENWDREVRENYLPLAYEEMLRMIPDTYEVIYKEHYTLSFLKEKIKEDWNIDFNIPTHMKIILKKREK